MKILFLFDFFLWGGGMGGGDGMGGWGWLLEFMPLACLCNKGFLSSFNYVLLYPFLGFLLMLLFI